jgi:hypothetical protein
MSNTQERLSTLQFEIAALRAQLAEIAAVPGHDHQRAYLFRELVYCVATYDALQRKHQRQSAYTLRQRAVNQPDQPAYG